MKRPTRTGHLVQLAWVDWQHGPGRITKMLGNGYCLVKWPRKGRPSRHYTRYLRRVEE